MKPLRLPSGALLTALLFLSSFQFPPEDMLPLGARIPLAERRMPATDGESYALQDLQEDQGLLLIFSCNTCPFVRAWEETYGPLSNFARESQIGMALVNSNAGKRPGEDSMAAMKEHAAEAGYQMPYLLDKHSELANAFGAKTTPHVFLFDQAGKLVYRGAINDKFENKDKTARQPYLMQALQQMVAGEAIERADTREIGCSIKRPQS